MAKAILKFYQNNSQFVEVALLKDQATSPATLVSGATLTGTLKDSTGAAQTGANSLVGVETPANSGNYIFAINGTGFNPLIGFQYTFVIDGTYAAGAKRYHAELPANVLSRDQGTET